MTRASTDPFHLPERAEGEEVHEAPGSGGSEKELAEQDELPGDERTSPSSPLGPWPAQLCVHRMLAEAESRDPAAAKATREAREAGDLAASGAAEEAQLRRPRSSRLPLGEAGGTIGSTDGRNDPRRGRCRNARSSPLRAPKATQACRCVGSGSPCDAWGRLPGESP